ncbi:MAG: hypothetical protein R3192_04210 [Woeseiaceae bacterium]|nr:hypothetical protein [Woeseiaceae bacterium]
MRKQKFATVLCARWKNTTPRRLRVLYLIPILLLLVPLGAHPETNSATAGIGGLNNGTVANGDGTGPARIEIGSVQLALVKEARDLSGNVLATNADVNPGQEIYFVLFVDNVTDVPGYDLTLRDALDETQFTYIADSLETTSVASGANAATRWSGAWTPLTDTLGGPDDEASILDTGGPADRDLLTVGNVAGQANALLQVPAQTQWAIRFRVRVN